MQKMVPLALLMGEKESWWLPYLDFQRVGVVRTGSEVGVDFGSAAEGAVVGDLVVKAEAVPVARAIRAAGHPTWERDSFRHPCTKCPDMQLCTATQRKVFKTTESGTERILCGFDTF